MIQDILMWISVGMAFGYTFYSFVKMIWNTFQERKNGCNGGCCSCAAKTDLLKNINFKTISKNNSKLRMIN